MSTKLENFLWGLATIAILGLCIFGIHSCNKKNKQEKKEKQEEKEHKHIQKQMQIINDTYLYRDGNGVYHSDKSCIVLLLGRYSDDKNSDAIYSVSYHKKNEITNWDKFAANNQLCTECFDSDLLGTLINKSQYKPDSIYIQNSNGNPAEKKYFIYDEFGNIISEEKWEYKDGTWNGVIKDVYEYDCKGNQIMSATYFWKDGKWKGSEWIGCKQEKKYDQYGNVEEIIGYVWKNNEWVIDKKFIRNYDEYNNLRYERYFEYNGHKWQPKNFKTLKNYY